MGAFSEEQVGGGDGVAEEGEPLRGGGGGGGGKWEGSAKKVGWDDENGSGSQVHDDGN